MRIIKKLFGGSEKNKKKNRSLINWVPLTSKEQLKEIEELSTKKTVAIFKHSTRCGISNVVIKRFESSFDASLKNFSIYYLDLLKFREVSDEIAHKFGVIHQSPQLIILKNKEVTAHASHYDINEIDLKKN